MTKRRRATRQIVLLAWRNVHRNWRHSLATMLAIASGFMAVSLFDGFLKDLDRQNRENFGTRGMLGHVLVEKREAMRKRGEEPWKFALGVEEQRFVEELLARDPDVVRRVRFLDIKGMVTNGRNNAVVLGFGYDIDEGAAVRGEQWGWNATSGKPLQLAREPSLALGRQLGAMMDCEETQKDGFTRDDGGYEPVERPLRCRQPRLQVSATTEAAQINALELPVAGLVDAGFREVDKHWVHMPLATAQRLFDTDKISAVSIQLRTEDAVPAFMERVRRAAAAAGHDLDVIRWEDHAVTSVMRSSNRFLGMFRNLFMALVVAISVMAVANSMMKAVSERVREIGTLRSLGFVARDIVVMFACEGLFISLLASGLGLTCTIVIGWLVSHAGLSYSAGFLSTPLPVRIAPAMLVWIVSAVSLSALASATAWICARRAAFQTIANALRHT